MLKLEILNFWILLWLEKNYSEIDEEPVLWQGCPA
jgi:hypothetical protein